MIASDRTLDKRRDKPAAGALTWRPGEEVVMHLIRIATASFALALVLSSCAEPPPPPATTAPSPATVETFVTGGRIDGANGIAVGPDGRLYVASVVSPGIFVLDAKDGHLVERLGPDEGARNPDDVAFGPDGTLCWTDILDGNVLCRPPGGETLVAGRPGPGVNPITFGPDGRLFVAQCFYGTGLFEVDPTGTGAPRLIRDDLGPGCGLNGMDWGPDGKLYGPRWFRGEVVKVDVDSGEYETVASGFGTPAAVKFDAQGRLHVLDTLAGQVVRVDGDTHTVVARLTPGLDNFDFGPDDRLYVSSFVDGFVAAVDGLDAVRTLSPGGVSMPGGVAVVGDTLYVADLFSLRRYDLTTAAEGAIVRDVIGFSDLGTVMSAHADADRLVLSSWNDRSIRIWDPASDTRTALFENRGRPIDALRFADEIVYTDFDTGAVVSFRPEAADSTTTRFQSGGVPAGLAVDGGALYVGEHTGGRLLKLAEDGRWLATPDVVAQGLQGPEGILVRDGTVFVVEAPTGSLATVRLADRIVRRIANGLATGSPPQADVPSTLVFSGIAADAAGRLYVGGERDNLIHRIVPGG